MTPEIHVFDDVLADPAAYRAAALAQPFGDVPIANVTFHGIAPAPSDELLAWVNAHFDPGPAVTTFLRLSPRGQEEPNYIHTDRDMGSWTGILYLNPDPPAGDGTTFWAHQPDGAQVSEGHETFDGQLAEWLAWRDLAQWQPWRTVAAAFNRLVLFPAGCFHSRALADNYGDGPDAARFIQVMFGGPACQ